MSAPTDPFTLSTHLLDDHYQDHVPIDAMDADELRSYHAACHSTGVPDHHHEERT